MVLEMLMRVATVAIIALNDRIVKLYFMFWIKKKDEKYNECAIFQQNLAGYQCRVY